jgi:hypothetical protein
MLLKEFFYHNQSTNEFANDRRYDNSRDSSVIRLSDTRKVKIRLRDINRLRLQAEAHEAEHASEASFIKKMYGTPPPEAPA